MRSVPSDHHVHSEWSWDASGGAMMETCRRAAEFGLPSIAFTEHADFTPWVSAERAAVMRRGGGVPNGIRPVAAHRNEGDFDVAGYLECIERCRAMFPSLHIMSGVELGEPHHFPDEVREILAHGPLDLVLGSSHCIRVDDVRVDLSARGFLDVDSALDKLRMYFANTLALVEQSDVFAVLAHLDYPKRYWPHAKLPYDERVVEDEYRAILRALVRSGRALEINTGRGADPARGLCPGPLVLRWWYEEGGRAVSFGSDAHDPATLTAGFSAATDAATAAGYRPARDPAAFWLR